MAMITKAMLDASVHPPSPGKATTSRLINRNVVATHGRTSMRLEPELWDALSDICTQENLSLGEVIQDIEEMGYPGGRTSAVRVYIVQYYRNKPHRARRKAV